jgi:hypothetical protein
MNARLALLTCLLATSAWGAIVYSGPRNIVIQGSPTANVTSTINLANGAGSWDRISFTITPPNRAAGSVRTGSEAEVAVVVAPGDYLARRLAVGESFPAGAVFGSSSFFGTALWDTPSDGDFYVSINLGRFGTGPYYPGWMHLKLENSATTTPKLTVIDWAYSDQVDQKPSMGQTSGIPGPPAPLSCYLGAQIPSIARQGGLTEPIGDVLLDCVGGSPTPAGQAIPTVDLVFSVSSALIDFTTNLGSAGPVKFTSSPTNGLFSEALLLADEPNVRKFSDAGLPINPLLNCGQLGAPDNGPSGPGVCSIRSTGDPLQSYDGTPNGFGSGTSCDGTAGRPTANAFGCGRPNVFQGSLSALTGENTVLRFSRVPLDPPGDAHRLFRLANVRVNVAGVAPATGFNLAYVTMDLAIQSAIPIPLTKQSGFTTPPALRVASIYIGEQNGGAERVVTSPILAREGSPVVFRTRNISAAVGDNNGVPGNGLYDGISLRYNGGTTYPADVAQNVPNISYAYYSESGFLWQNNGVNRPPAVNPPLGIGNGLTIPLRGGPLGSVGYGGTNTGIDKSGLANSGTRVAFKFTNIPAGATVELPPTVNLVQSGTTFVTGVAALTFTDANGAGPYTPRSGFFTAQDNLAVYEILFADPSVQDDLSVPFTLTNAPAGTQLKAIVMLAPFYSRVEAGNPSAALPEPRFADPTQYVPCLTVACVQATPTQGLNTAPVNVTITGTPAAQGFAVLNNAQVKLSASGLPDILGTNTSNTPDVWTLKTSFNLTGAAAGTRSIIVTAADGKSFSAGTFTIQAAACLYNVTPLTASFNTGGGSGQINVTASTPGCTWTASTTASWIALKTKTPTTQPYSVAANMTNTTRSGSILIGGKTVQVTQEGACVYTLSDDRQQFHSFGGWAYINVTARSGCTWSAVSAANWIMVLSGRSGSGSGRVLISVLPNWGASRTGRVSIAGKTFSASQACANWWCRGGF